MTKQDVVENVDSIPLQNISVDAQTTFCKLWPTVREALLLLIKVAPAMTFIINLVIAAGDALAKRICQ